MTHLIFLLRFAGLHHHRHFVTYYLPDLCAGLHRHSRHAYSFMAKIFAMPTEQELLKWGALDPEALHADGDVAANNVSLTEAEALVDEVTFDNLMSVIL